jgi:hypothetical protein
MPERVKNIEDKMETISSSLVKVTDILSKPVRLWESQDARSIAEGQRSLKDYVF